MSASDIVKFARAWIRAPLQIGAVLPSGGALARLITSEIGPDTGPVIELGPGTGVFTSALLARGVQPSDLTLIEADPDFVRLLQLRFPGVRVLCADASRLTEVPLDTMRPAGAVVSGLPLLAMAPDAVTGIVTGSFAHLRPGGSFYQFTYGPRCPVPPAVLDRLGLEAVRVGRTFRNFPPAAVYRISRRSSLPRTGDRADRA
jgi:phospholipid N-methyltransferase